MEEDQQFCLRWNNHQSTLISVFDTLLENGTLVDCTLAAEGKFLKAHKVVLSACSPYFATLLSEQYDKHPIFILKDVKYQELRAMMDYMYRGEVNISQDQLAALLKAAESLQIKGLSDNRCGGGNQKPSSAEHKQLSVPGKLTGASGGYTLEQTKRARLGPSSVESQELSGSREGSSSPTSRRRKKVRRRSVDNVMADNHDNSNSSQSMQVNSSVPSANTQVGTITSVASIVPAAVSSLATSANLQAANITKKTDSLTKLGNTDAITTGADNEHADDNADKSAGTVSKKEQNHHKQRGATSSKIIVNESGKETEIVIEPKSEYDDGNDETVEDLTLDDEDMGLEDLDHTAGPSHGGEGSSQGYAQWQVDRSQDEVFMAAQEAQQRDPQDLSKKIAKGNNGIPVIKAPTSATASTSNKPTNVPTQSNGKHVMSMSDVSEMLIEFYKVNNTAKAPKNAKTEKHMRQASPFSADGAAIAHSTTSPKNGDSKIPNEPEKTAFNTASKNVNGDEMANNAGKKNTAPFHPRIKYSSVNKNGAGVASQRKIVPKVEPVDVSPLPLVQGIPSSVIQPPMMTAAPAAAAFAAALFRDGYNNFQQQLRAQEELMKQQKTVASEQSSVGDAKSQQLFNLNNFLRKENRSSENDDGSGSELTDDEEEDSKYAGFDDIHLIEGSKSGYSHHMSLPTDYLSDDSQKYMIANMKGLEYSMSDYGGGSPGEEPLYQCRHCGKKYRWKSTLRRHENVECGGKEPSHQCPYCPYKSKQRGNLGVHVRKHHAALPQLASKRRSKYSQPGNFIKEESSSRDVTI